MAGDFQIAVDYESFVGSVRVNADPAGVKHRIGRSTSLPVLLYLVLEHPRIRSLKFEIIISELIFFQGL